MKPTAARHRGLAPQVTVAIPTRNRLALLQEAVRSVLSQSVKCWELIVVDDASSDGTWTWLSSLRDDRVRIVRNEQPTERSAARNRALALARTPYILYLDDDDRLTPRALQCLISGVQRAPGVTAVIGRRVLFDEQGNRRLARHVRRRTTRWTWQDVMVGWGAGVGTALCRVETVRAVGGWDESLDVAEDQDLLLRLTARGPVQLVPDLALEQRMRPAQPQPEEAKRAELSVREAFLAGAGSTRRRHAERTFRSWQARRAGDAAMADRRYARALRSYAQEIWRCPALLRSPLVRPHWVAQTAKALIGCCLGGYGASAARSVKARARLAVKRAPGERRGQERMPVTRGNRWRARYLRTFRQQRSGLAVLRALLPGSVANLSVQAVLLALGLFTGIIAARVLGPRQRGELSLLVLVPTMLTVLGTLGTEYGIYYLWHQEHGRLRPRLFGTCCALSAASGTFFGAVGFIAVAWFEPSAGLQMDCLVALSMPLSIANTVLTMALMANRHVTPYNVSRVVGPALYACAVATLWIAGGLSVPTAFLAWFGATVCTVVVDVGLVIRLGSGKPQWDVRVVKRSMSYGLRSYAGTVSQYGTLRLDQALLVALSGNAALGLYYSAVSVAETILYLANNVGAAMMAQFAGRSRAEMRHLAVVTMMVVGATTTLAAALLMVLGGKVIILLLGRAYLPGLTALRVLLPGIIPLAMARVMIGYFIAVGQAKVFARASVVSLVVTVAGDALLIHRYQAVGAAVASAAAYLVLGIWMAMVFRADGRNLVGTEVPAVEENRSAVLE